MIRYFFILFVISFTLPVVSQIGGITGLVIDSSEELPLPGANVLIRNIQDTLVHDGTITSLDGRFELNAQQGKYALQISFMGFKVYKDTLTIDDAIIDLSTLMLVEDSEVLDEINVVSNLAPTFQRGDTTLYNPDAFKVSLDATANDLILKMPGFFEVDGQLLAMGDTIKEVLVDGKRFFGNNVQEALRTIRPEMIKEIEVYQYKSDEARYSGFEDMNTGQTINIITKQDKRSLLVGEFATGLGKDNRYVGDGNISRYNERNRLNMSANMNNVNVPIKLNRGGARQIISGNDIENRNFNVNYGLSGKHDFNVMYRYNNADSENYSTNHREYVAGALAGQANANESRSVSGNAGHNINLNWRTHSSEKYQLTASARINSSNRESRSLNASETLMNEVLLNTNKRDNRSYSESGNLGNQLGLIYRLNDKGSAISANLDVNLSQNESDGALMAETRNGKDEVVQLVDQISGSDRTNTSLRFGINYSQALNKESQLNYSYSYHMSNGYSNKKSYDYDEISGDYLELDSLTSSDFSNNSLKHIGRIAFKTKSEKSNLFAGLNVSHTVLESEEVFPKKEHLKESFLFFEPQVKYTYQTSQKLNIQFSYGMSNRNPSIRNLQSIVDNDNPLYISTGNPNLKSSRTHSATIALRKSNAQKGTFTSLNFRASLTNDMVAQNRVVVQNDTVVLGEYFLPAGGQFSQPLNLDGRFNLGLNGTVGMSINKIKSKLNSQTGLNYSHTPNIINNIKSFSNRINLSQSFVLSSNISEKIDFTLSSRSNYSMVDGSKGSSGQSNYFSQSSSFNLYYNFYKYFIFKTNTGHTFTGASGKLQSNNRLYLNVSLSTKLFKNKKGEIILSAYDLAHKQDEMVRMVDEFSVSESYQPTLNQFYMLSFAYRL